MIVLELARCEWIERQENVIALGPSGTGKTHVALGLGLAARQKGLPVAFVTAAALVNELMEARDEKRLMRLQRQLAKVKLLIIDELGFVPLSKTGHDAKNQRQPGGHQKQHHAVLQPVQSLLDDKNRAHRLPFILAKILEIPSPAKSTTARPPPSPLGWRE